MLLKQLKGTIQQQQELIAALTARLGEMRSRPDRIMIIPTTG